MTCQGPAEWKAHVYGYRGKRVGNGVRLLLVLMAEHMDGKRYVSVPRSQLADALGISRREVADRLTAAKEAGLLDSVRAGRPGVTAVYQGLFPADGDHGVPKEDGDHGGPTDEDYGGPKEAAQHGSGNPPMQTPAYGDPVVRASSKRKPSESPGDQQAAPRGEPTTQQGEDEQPIQQAPGSPLERPSSATVDLPAEHPLRQPTGTVSGSATRPTTCGQAGCGEVLDGVALDRGWCGPHWLTRILRAS